MIQIWTEEEKDLLYTDMTTQEIQEKTGRTAEAIRKKRYKLTGHYVEADKQGEKRSNTLQRLYPYMDVCYKEARILELANQMKVRLMG